MKIGFDAKRFFHNFTGLGNYSRSVVETLAKFHPENEYHLFNPKQRESPRTDFVKNYPNIHTHLPQGISAALHPLWRSYWINSDLKKCSLDVFHGLSNELPMGIEKTGIRSVVTIHDLIFERFPQLYPLIDRNIYSHKFKSACHRADQIVAISQQTKNEIMEWYDIPETEIKVIYQSCSSQFYPEMTKGVSVEAVLKKYQLPSEYLLYVGTINERKNLMGVLKALKGIEYKTDIPCVVIGDGTHYLKVVEQYVERHGLEKRFILRKKVDFSDMPTLYRSAQLFIYPSIAEGFGIPIIEALNSSIPVITGTAQCLREAGGPESAYIDPFNAEQMGADILDILHNNSRRERMISSGLEYVERFRDARVGEEWIKNYNDLKK